MNELQVSVAMCTYNGAIFLEAQLNSIASQTQLPNELVVCDDGSTDSTIEILERFALEAPFLVRIYQNPTPLRVTKNFEKSLQLCTGDVLFLCDQDDLWRSDKVATVMNTFEQNPVAEIVYSDAELINEHGEALGQRQWNILRLYAPQLKQWQEGNATDLVLGGTRVTGCMVAVKKQFVDAFMPFPTHIRGYIHDSWIGLVGSVLNVMALCPEPLTMYRQHPNQQIGIRSNQGQKPITLKERFKRPREEKLGPLLQKRDQLIAIEDALKKVIPHEHLNLLKIKKKIVYLQARCSLSDNHFRRIIPVLNHLLNGNYHRYADQDANFLGGFWTALGDIIE